MEFAWRVGGLSNWLFLGLISTITPIRVPFRVLISLLTTYLLSPPTLQVGTGNSRFERFASRIFGVWGVGLGLKGLRVLAGLSFRELGSGFVI